MSPRCTGVPVSWLRLERYRLGELLEEERREVAAHLASCPACAACAARVEADEGVELPRIVRAAPPTRSRLRRVFAVAGPLAAAAAVLLAVGHAWRTRPVEETPGTSRAKGGSVVFALVRDDGERVNEESGVFRDGDRFKALVTCPPSMSARFDLVVVDAQGTSFPLVAGPLACGNEVPLPGAFRLTGAEDERVCLVWSEDGEVDRGALMRTGTPPEGRSLCKELAARP